MKLTWKDSLRDKVWEVGDVYWIYEDGEKLYGTIIEIDYEEGCTVEWSNGMITDEGTPGPASDYWKMKGYCC